MTDGAEEVLAAKFALLLPELGERQRRLLLGAEADALGRGGIAWVHRRRRVATFEFPQPDPVAVGPAGVERGGVAVAACEQPVLARRS